MKQIMVIAALISLVACGVETVGTAATVAVVKKNELEQGRKTVEQSQERLEQMNQQMQQRAENAGGDR